MTEEHIKEELDAEPFIPLRLHLVGGKTVDVLRPDAVMPLRDRLLLFLKLAKNGRAAEIYDIIAYAGIERIERLDIGRTVVGKRKKSG